MLFLKKCFVLRLTVAFGIIAGSAFSQQTSPSAERMTASLRPEHPRLIFLKQDEERIRSLQSTDPYFVHLVEIVMREADASLDDSVIVHRKIGKRLLKQCRESLSRITHLSMAYRLTNDKKYLLRAEKELLAAANLSDWNPSHFLDVAEMAAGLAIGYDWLYHDLSDSTRKKIRTALIDKALQPGFTQTHWWEQAKNNWNQVCNTGLALAGLAIAEDESEWAERAVQRACNNIRVAMKASYEPTGVYPEGPGYWDYGTNYNVVLIAALESALGTDFQLAAQEGFDKTVIYRLLVVGPDGEFFKYSDCGEQPEISPGLYWFAQKLKKPEIAWMTRAYENNIINALPLSEPPRPGRWLPLSLIWYSPGEEPETPPPLDYLGTGLNPIALFRSSWQKDALWLAFKGGNNQNNHNHMDAGQFVILAGGVRWSEDLGADNYHILEQLPGNLWGAGRYEFFRPGIQSHSTLILNNKQQEIQDSASPVIKFCSSSGRSHAVIDMSSPWRGDADQVLRGAAMLDKRSFLIQDEITGAKGEILWQMITVDDIKLKGNQAVMEKNGQRFFARILSPRKASFEIRDARPKYPKENQNRGYAKLVIRISQPRPKVTIAVHMWLDGTTELKKARIKPLSEWETE